MQSTKQRSENKIDVQEKPEKVQFDSILLTIEVDSNLSNIIQWFVTRFKMRNGIQNPKWGDWLNPIR